MLLKNRVMEILKIKNSLLNYIKQRNELASKYFKVKIILNIYQKKIMDNFYFPSRYSNFILCIFIINDNPFDLLTSLELLRNLIHLWQVYLM